MFISRDPFAREELHSRKVILTRAAPNRTCDWCGQVKTDKDNELYLYEYRVESDANAKRPGTIKGLFCSASCMRTYHG
jgi:hypothetical protein